MPWAKRQSKPIPSISSPTKSLELNDYSAGHNAYVSNDKFPVRDGASNMWRKAQNARIVTLGEYDTRKGFDIHSVAVGETLDASQIAITGAGNQSFSQTARLAQKFTTGSAGQLVRIDVNIKNANSATGTPIIELWTNASGAPGTLISRSSLDAADVGTSYDYETVRFPDAPALTTATVYWIVMYVQAVGTNSYSWSSTTSATTALSSDDSGATWSATSFDLNFRQYYATAGGAKGLFRAYKSDGTAVTLIAHGTTLSKVNDVTGALTTIKSGLSASATDYQFKVMNDIVYYVNGYDGYRKWDFTTESQVNATNYTHIEHHKGMAFLARKDEPTRIDFSNFGEYETFTSTDFVYAIGPKTGDPVTALVSLNGYLIIQTLNNKIILSGNDNATFSDDVAPDSKGTYSQRTVVADGNFIYYLAEDGVFRSNGSEAQLLSENVYEEIRAMANKDDCCMAINKGRLYLWYRSSGSAYNDKCYVWNLNYSSNGNDSVESHDTKAYVCRALTAFRDEDDLLVASSIVGQVFWQEKASNDYTNLGGDIDYELQTHYFTFGSPSALKEVRYWLPRFGAQSDSYAIDCQYATDLRDNWQTHTSPNVQGTGPVWGSSATVWGSFTWGTTAEIQSSLYIPGEYRRIAIRYKHYATRQPHKFLGHSLVIQTRRMR